MNVARGRHQMRTSSAIRCLIVALSIVLTTCLSACSGDSSPDTDALREYVDEYVRLLNDGSEEALREHLANPPHPDDAAARLKAYGHRGLYDVEVTWSNPVAPEAFTVSIEAKTQGGEVIRMIETVGWNDPSGGYHEWHWAMGPMNRPQGTDRGASHHK